MANLTDPLIRAVQGSDPQNLMEYITRQKIYDNRFWKEECFGLTVADVLEKAAKTLTCIGGTFGANQQPTKFLCLILKLLQLQPDVDLIREAYIEQDKFKYVKILGAFYLRLTGRPATIYETLEPQYANYSRLRVRLTTEWKLLYMDEAIHELLTQPYFCGIALPRLPSRTTLEGEGFLEEGPRPSALKDAIMDAGGLEEFLKYKAQVLKSPAALALWKERNGEKAGSAEGKSKKRDVKSGKDTTDETNDSMVVPSLEEGEEAPSEYASRDRNTRRESDNDAPPQRKKKKKDKGYGTLFKSDKRERRDREEKSSTNAESQKQIEGSEEYWNEERAKLGLKPLRN